LEKLKRETEKAGAELARVAAFFVSDKKREDMSNEPDVAAFELDDCFAAFEEAIKVLRTEADLLETEIVALRGLYLSEERIKAR